MKSAQKKSWPKHASLATIVFSLLCSSAFSSPDRSCYPQAPSVSITPPPAPCSPGISPSPRYSRESSQEAVAGQVDQSPKTCPPRQVPRCNRWKTPPSCRVYCPPKGVSTTSEVSPLDALASWIADSLSTRPAVRELLDYWENLSGHRPVIEVSLGAPNAPARHASFPLGLSAQKQLAIKVHHRPATRSGQFSDQLEEALVESFRAMSADYYRLAAAHIRSFILKTRIESLRAIREMNRELSNDGLASWTEVVYLDSLINTQVASWSSNNLDIAVLYPLFAKSPMRKHLASGRVSVWGTNDFWKFFPKLPPRPSDAEISPSLLYAQFEALSRLRDSIATRQSMAAIREQIKSEATMEEGSIQASAEILAAARSQECDARLSYLESLLLLPPPATVDFVPLPIPSPTPQAPSPPSQVRKACDSSSLGLKIAGILALAAGMIAVLRIQSGEKDGSPD